VCLLAFVLRAWWLDRLSFWLDEGFSAALSAGPLWYILQQSFTKEPNPPFYFVLLHLWRGLAGNGEYAIRYISLLPSVAAVPLLYGLGRRMAFGRGSWRLGLLAAALGSVSPYLVWLAQEARMYSWALLWTVLAAYGLARFLGTPSRRWWLTFALASLLAVYTHLYAAFVVGAEGLFLLLGLMRAKDRRPWLAGLGAAALVAALFAPWFISVTAYAGETSTWRGFIGVLDMLRVLGDNFASQNHLPSSVDGWFELILAILAAAGTARLLFATGGRSHSPVPAARLPVYWLIVPIAGVYLLSFKEPLFSPRYFIVVVPAFLLLTAAGLAALPRTAALTLLGLVSAGSIWAIGRGNTIPAYAKEDYRLAASYVGNRSTADDAIVLVANYIQYPFQYYFHGAGQVIPLDVDPQSSLDPLLSPLAAHDHVWLVEAHDVFVDPQDRVGAWLRARYTVADEKYITGIHFIDFDVHPTVDALPAAAHATNAQFAGGPALAGYTVEPGAVAHVTLYWQTAPLPTQDFHISLKLWDGSGQVRGQQDGEPLNAGLPFSRFPRQGLVKDEHYVAAPPGVYNLIMSVYLPGQQDLALTGQSGGGQLTLGSVAVGR